MIDNRTLTLVVTACFVMVLTSVSSAFIIINLSNPQPEIISGKAVSQDANVRIIVDGTLSITTIDDDLINFSGCAPGEIIYSNVYDGNAFQSCRGHTPDNMSVRNDGAVDADISINISAIGQAHGGSFLPSPSNSSYVLYSAQNGSALLIYSGGCIGTLQESWTNITNSSMFSVCDRLQADPTANSVQLNIGFYIPEQVQAGSNELIISFVASPVA